MDLFLFPSPSNVVFHARGSDDTLTVRLDQNDHLAGIDKVSASGLNEAVQQAHFYTIQSSKIQRVQQPRSSQTQDYLYKLNIINAILIIFAQNVRPVLAEVCRNN